jgi:rRNA-processing protein FCF1
MYNLIFDSDALIKLTYSEIIQKTCENFNCFITDKVKEETVDEGKKRFYPDADIIENLIERKLLKTKNPKKTIEIKDDLGKGEQSVLSLYKTIKKCIIITDDQYFIKQLEKENINFIVPADVIVLLKKLGKINLKESLYHLNKIKIFIKKETYKSVKKDLEES